MDLPRAPSERGTREGSSLTHPTNRELTGLLYKKLGISQCECVLWYIMIITGPCCTPMCDQAGSSGWTGTAGHADRRGLANAPPIHAQPPIVPATGSNDEPGPQVTGARRTQRAGEQASIQTHIQRRTNTAHTTNTTQLQVHKVGEGRTPRLIAHIERRS